jgi:hypothetical protein
MAVLVHHGWGAIDDRADVGIESLGNISWRWRFSAASSAFQRSSAVYSRSTRSSRPMGS